MDVNKDGKTLSKVEQENELSDEQVKRSVIISNIPKGAKCDDLYIHFQKKGNGGGEIDELKILDDGKALLIFEEQNVAESVLEKEQKFGEIVLQLQPYIKKEIVSEKMDVFSLVSAKINPKVLNMSPEEIEHVLSKIAQETKINYIELCDGFWVSGTYKQINFTCLKLSACATPGGASKNDVSSNSHDVRQQDHEPAVLDVQPKLMHILRNHIKEIKERYKMKIEQKEGKVMLSPLDNNWESFESGKEEFITLYQKTFQEMDEKSFELKEDATNIKQLGKEIMEQFDVFIEFRNRIVCIYGRNEHVVQSMQRLQGKPRRSRRACKPSSDELPKPDTFATLPQLLSHKLENGVTVTVYQGDITKQEVDVIVNAANDCLEHGGGVAGAIVKQGGFQIQQESRQYVHKYGKVPVGQVAQTGPGRLRCKMIFHAVGPRWNVNGPEGSRRLIANACWNSLSLGNQYGARSIVFPAISSGIFGVPKEVCAEVLFSTAEMFSCEITSQHQLRDIRFVNIDSPTNDAFRREFHKRYVKNQLTNIGPFPTNNAEPASISNRSGNIKKPFSNNDVKTGDHIPTNVASSKAAPLENKTINSPSYAAAAAAMKRAEQRKSDVTNETLQQKQSMDPADTASDSSFKKGFNSRQSMTQRDDENDIDKRERNTSPQEPKDHETKKAPSDEKLGTGSKVPSGHKSSVANDSSKERGRSKSHLKSPSEMKSLGRGRGALSHSKSNFAPTFYGPGHAERVPNLIEQPSLSPKNGKSSSNSDASTEKAEFTKPSLDQSSNDGRNSQPHTLQPPPTLEGNEKGQHQHGEKEQHLSDNPTGSLRPGACPPGLDVTPEGLNFAAKSFEGNTSSASLSQPADFQENNMNEHCMKRKSLEDPSERSPKLRKEDQQESGGLPPDKKEQLKEDDKGLETSSTDDSIKKEDDERKKHQKQRGDAVAKQEDVKDQKQSGGGANTKQGNKKHQEESGGEDNSKQDNRKDRAGDNNTKQGNKKDQEESGGDENSKQGNKKDQEESGGDKNSKQGDKKDQEESGGDKNSKQGDKKDQEESDGDDNSKQGDKKDQEESGGADNSKKGDKKDQEESGGDDNTKQGDKKDQEESGGDDNTKQGDKKDQEDNCADDNTKQGDKKDQEENSGDDSIKHDDKKDQEQKHKDKEKEGNEKTCAEREHEEVQNNEDIEDGNENQTDKYNDLDQISDSANSTSMESFVVLNIEDEQQINRTYSADNKADESSSSESIVLIDATDECRPNGKLQSENSSQSISTANTKQSKQEEGIISDDNESSSVVEKPKNYTEASVKTRCNVEMSDRETNEGTDDSYRGAQKQENNLRGEQFPLENEVPSKKSVSKIESDDVDNLANMMQGLSTSDNNSATRETPVDKNTTALPAVGECGLCKTTAITNDNPEVILSGCGHVICKQCTGRFNDQKSYICPTCEKKAGCNTLQPPNGQIRHRIMESSPLPGFDGNKTIYIDYHFDGGIQGSCHPNPGLPYDSLERRTFLPDTAEGRKVLELLQEAFEAGLLFTVGRCTINSKEDQIIFSDVVEHKFNLKGTTTYGYPDPDYLGRAKEMLELALKKKSSAPSPPEGVGV